MYLSFSLITSNRRLPKAVRRVYSRFDSLKAAYERVEMGDPIHEGIILCLVDQPLEHFEEIENDDGIFEVEVGYDQSLTFQPAEDDRLASLIADKVELVTEKCPFTIRDGQRFRDVVRRWREAEHI